MSKLKVSGGDGGGYSPPGYYREQAPAVIDVKSEESLDKWETVLHLSRSELLQAIKDFGPVVRDIRRGLLNQSDEAA